MNKKTMVRMKTWLVGLFVFVSCGIRTPSQPIPSTAEYRAPLGFGSVIFMVKDTSGNPVAGVNISLYDMRLKAAQPPVITGERGTVVRHNLVNHKFKVTLEKPEYVTQEQTVQVVAGIKRVVVAVMETKDEAFMKALPEHPKVHAVYFYNKAVRFYRELRYDEALTALAMSIEKNPEFVKAHFLTGWIHYKQRNDDAALTSMKRVLELDDQNVTVCRILADIYDRGQQPELFDRYTALAISIGGATAVDEFNQAVKYFNAGDILGAIPAFESAVAKNPKMADAYYHLGVCYLHRGDRRKAAETLERYLEITAEGRYAEQARSTLKTLSRR
jgi:TolA-binding protein